MSRYWHNVRAMSTSLYESGWTPRTSWWHKSISNTVLSRIPNSLRSRFTRLEVCLKIWRIPQENRWWCLIGSSLVSAFQNPFKEWRQRNMQGPIKSKKRGPCGDSTGLGWPWEAWSQTNPNYHKKWHTQQPLWVKLYFLIVFCCGSLIYIIFLEWASP